MPKANFRFFTDAGGAPPTGGITQSSSSIWPLVEFTTQVEGFRFERRVNWHTRVQDIDRASILLDFGAYWVTATDPPTQDLRGGDRWVRGSWIGISLEDVNWFEGYVVRSERVSWTLLELDVRGLGEMMDFEFSPPEFVGASSTTLGEYAVERAHAGQLPLPLMGWYVDARKKLIRTWYMALAASIAVENELDARYNSTPAGPLNVLGRDPLLLPPRYDFTEIGGALDWKVDLPDGFSMTGRERAKLSFREYLQAMAANFFGFIYWGSKDVTAFPTTERKWGLYSRSAKYYKSPVKVANLTGDGIEHTRYFVREGYSRVDLTRQGPVKVTGVEVELGSWLTPHSGEGFIRVRPRYQGRRFVPTSVSGEIKGLEDRVALAGVNGEYLEFMIPGAGAGVGGKGLTLSVICDGWSYPEPVDFSLGSLTGGGQTFHAPPVVVSTDRARLIAQAWKSSVSHEGDFTGEVVIEEDPGGTIFQDLGRAGLLGVAVNSSLYGSESYAISGVMVRHIYGSGVTQTRFELMPLPDVSGF